MSLRIERTESTRLQPFTIAKVGILGALAAFSNMGTAYANAPAMVQWNAQEMSPASIYLPVTTNCTAIKAIEPSWTHRYFNGLSGAVEDGSLELTAGYLMNGCTPTYRDIMMAISNNDVEMVKLLAEYDVCGPRDYHYYEYAQIRVIYALLNQVMLKDNQPSWDILDMLLPKYSEHAPEIFIYLKDEFPEHKNTCDKIEAYLKHHLKL